jgi:dTDP-4-dehydrorhamnose reductase
LSIRRALVTGAAGQLGWELQRTVPPGWEVTALARTELDITSARAVDVETARYRPDVVINAAAYTSVDEAERKPSLAFAVNETGPANLAAASKMNGFKLLHVSTDFVFDGKRADKPYRANDDPLPLGTYGASKLAGERRIADLSPATSVVLRTAWLYSAVGQNFVRTILRNLSEGRALRVVADQIGSPTWARSLAEMLWRFADAAEVCGTFHWVDAGETSRYEFALAIQQQALELGLIEAPGTIEPVATSENPSLAKRPGYSVLDCAETVSQFGHLQTPWRDSLRAMMSELRLKARLS